MMRSINLLSVVFGFFTLFTLSGAWPWSSSGDSIYGLFIGKRDSSSSSTATTSIPTATPTNSASTGSSTGTTGTNSASTGTHTGTKSGSTNTITTGTGATKTTHTTHSTITTIDPRLPAGGISMITPGTSILTTYYKIGNYVTFAWNYTSLSFTPSAIDVYATCSLNSATYTIANNISVSETGAVTWDTNAYQASATVPLLTAAYTLVVIEAGKSVTDVASAGYLAPGTYDFAMYLPQPYTPLNEGFVCATCNAAISDMKRQALGFMFAMATITVISFTLFTGGFGF